VVKKCGFLLRHPNRDYDNALANCDAPKLAMWSPSWPNAQPKETVNMEEGTQQPVGFPAAEQPDVAPLGQRRKSGRPKGSLGLILIELSDRVTMEDFAFLRALVNGVEPRRAFQQYYSYRYFDHEGRGVIPSGLSLPEHGRRLMAFIMKAALASGDELLNMMAQRLGRVYPQRNEDDPPAETSGASTAKRGRAEPSLREWMDSANVDEDFYGEAELLEQYEHFLAEFRSEHGLSLNRKGPDESERRALMESQLQAINLLQNRLTSYPHADHPLHSWIEKKVALKLANLGLTTMGELVGFISTQGRNWRRKVPGLGPVRAERLEGWLDSNQATLGNIVRSGPQWDACGPLRRVIRPLEMATSSSSSALTQLVLDPRTGVMVPQEVVRASARGGIAPLELLVVPPHLDGMSGMFRSSASNHYGARTDLQAIQRWLATYLEAGKTATFDAYRREIERFYIWCLNEARVPISSVSLSHALGYQAFLKAIPTRYITHDRVARHDPRWRPFRGQLDPKSQRYALGVVSGFFEAATRNAYLTGNPFASVKSAAVQNRDLDTSRSLSAEDLSWLRLALEEHVSATPRMPPSGFDLQGALRRRLNLIFHIGLSTGLRRAELVSSTVASLQPAVYDGIPSEDEWMLEVIGKGKRVRTVPIRSSLRMMIEAHHEDVRRMLRESGQIATARRDEFERRPPLICALRAPVGSKSPMIDDDSQMANDNLALGHVGLYRVVKGFFTGASKPKIRDLEQRLRAIDRKARVTEMKPDTAISRQTIIQLRQELADARRELAVWQRRSAMSTHWMRHTFAMGVLRDNPNDAGLKLAQQLLGHASIATTQIYLKVDDTAKLKAIRNLKPFG